MYRCIHLPNWLMAYVTRSMFCGCSEIMVNKQSLGLQRILKSHSPQLVVKKFCSGKKALHYTKQKDRK